MKLIYSGIFCGSVHRVYEGDILGVDLDGTLAHTFAPYDPRKIGPPIPRAIRLLKQRLAQGEKVVILTARMHSSHTPEQLKFTRKLIEAWCLKYIGQKFPITAEKHPRIYEIWDDRAREMVRDKGILKK